MAALDRTPSWLVIAVSCLSTLTVFGAGAGFWLARTGYPSRQDEIVAYRETGVAPPVAAPKSFPSWLDVPHLGDPRGHAVTTAARASGDLVAASRSFLVSQPDLTETRVIASARTGGSSDAFETVPLDSEAWIDAAPEPSREIAATPASVEVATLPPASTPTIGPAAAVQARSASPPAPPRNVSRPPIVARRPARPGADTDQTASIIGPSRPVPPHLYAGAIARASLHRSRTAPSSGSQAPAQPGTWTLPPALAPSP